MTVLVLLVRYEHETWSLESAAVGVALSTAAKRRRFLFSMELESTLLVFTHIHSSSLITVHVTHPLSRGRRDSLNGCENRNDESKLKLHDHFCCFLPEKVMSRFDLDFVLCGVSCNDPSYVGIVEM